MGVRRTTAHSQRQMTAIRRLVTLADVYDDPSQPGQVSVSARHELELADGRRVLLLDDRGWGSSGSWPQLTVKEIQENARTVVGPIEPPDGRSQEEAARLHWANLQRIAQRHGVAVDVDKLRELPHDVVLSQRLLARIGGGSETG